MSQDTDALREALADARKIVRFAWGAISSGQTTDKEVEKELRKLQDRIDAALATRTESETAAVDVLRELDMAEADLPARIATDVCNQLPPLTFINVDSRCKLHGIIQEVIDAALYAAPAPERRDEDLRPGLKWARKLCMGGSFLHDDAPPKRWAQEFDKVLAEEIERLDRKALRTTTALAEGGENG